MLSKVQTIALSGVRALPVEVEAYTASAPEHSFTIVGLGDSAVREARDRVISAIKQSGFRVPKRILVNLAPAELKKEGAGYDLAIALSILLASEQISKDSLCGSLVAGELALDGRVKPVRGAVAIGLHAAERRVDQLLLPSGNADEASVINGLTLWEVSDLRSLVEMLDGRQEAKVHVGSHAELSETTARKSPFEDVRGQLAAKRGLAVAAAGGHNLVMVGPPGCGKSMLAKRFPLLLPKLNRSEVQETAQIYSIFGAEVGPLLSGERQIRAPHHTISEAGLTGGGSQPRPGEVTFAHNGVLFLDELPEFRRGVLECLRTPLETGRVLVSRASGSLCFPAKFQLLAAMNPCPCGLGGSCECSPHLIQRYRGKISQPIIDRIDLHLELEPVHYNELLGEKVKDTFDYRAFVDRARPVQFERQGKLNSELDTDELSKLVELSGKSKSLLERASERYGLSARGLVRTLRVARTLADMEGERDVTSTHVAEALSYRVFENA